MIDREGRIVFGSLLAFVLALAGSIVVERQFGIALRDRPLVSLFVFAGVAVVLPQLYLARTNAPVGPRSRLRFAAVATAVFAVAFAPEADGVGQLAIATIGTGSLLALCCYEAVSGYRDAGNEVSIELPYR